MKRAALLLPIFILAHAAACGAPATGALTPEVRAQLLQKVTTALQADGTNSQSRRQP